MNSNPESPAVESCGFTGMSQHQYTERTKLIPDVIINLSLSNPTIARLRYQFANSEICMLDEMLVQMVVALGKENRRLNDQLYDYIRNASIHPTIVTKTAEELAKPKYEQSEAE